jgi:hypothetical protein
LICASLQGVNSSNGILGLVTLAKTIEKLGRGAHMCQIIGENDEGIYGGDLANYHPADGKEKLVIAKALENVNRHGVRLLTDFSREKIESSYVIYPDAVLDNPLSAPHVVRYFGNRDGILKNGDKVRRGADDFLLAHSRFMVPEAHHICSFTRVNPLFNRAGSLSPLHRTLDLSYVGKGDLYGFNATINNAVAITRSWPDRKEDLAILLRHCRFFYTADACSHINNEALSCGAIPVFLHNGPWTDAEIDGFEAGAMPRLRPGEACDDAKFERFELDRERYLQGLAAIEQQWEPSVQALIEKVDRHFESRRKAAPRLESRLVSSRRLSRKERKRRMGKAGRTDIVAENFVR